MLNSMWFKGILDIKGPSNIYSLVPQIDHPVQQGVLVWSP